MFDLSWYQIIALTILLYCPYRKLEQIHEELKKFNEGRMS
jgi:hypothetical protein